MAAKYKVMGNGASHRQRDKDLRLNGTEIRFNQQQLRALNIHFSEQLDNSSGELKCDKDIIATEVLVERLIQRLVCGVGTLDARFSCKFLITLDPTKTVTKGGLSFSYLVRLDCLSSPPLYPDQWEQPTCHLVEGEGGPQGFARIRLQGEGAENWAEFVNNNGFLRRDKIQERFVELLAQSAARSSVPGRPDQVDESRLCGAPGKVVDAGIAQKLLEIPVQEQLYYGPGECNRRRFPDPREYRIAIVEGAPCVRLRIGLQPPLCLNTVDEDIQVTLILGIGFQGWPQSCDFPGRVSLAHIDMLLYQQAATTGFYLVPAPPHPTLRCEDRTATWQFRFPAAELALLTDYSENSVPHRVLSTLRNVLADLRRTTNGGQVISDYMLKTLLWSSLEIDRDTVIATMKDWDHDKLSEHVLVILDKLIIALRTQRYRSYFFPWFNIMLNSPGGGTLHYTEEDYAHDAELVYSFLLQLSEISSPPHLSSDQEQQCWQKMESKLVNKWADVLSDLAPPNTTRSRRLSLMNIRGYTTAAASQYSVRQLEYIGHILRGMLLVRSLTLSQNSHIPVWFSQTQNNDQTSVNKNENSEDIIYLLTVILEQAKILSQVKKKKTESASNRTRSKTRHTSQSDTIHSTKSFDLYSVSIFHLMEEVRKDKSNLDLSNDMVLVHQVLKWLYYGLDSDKRMLSHILRPYLNRLFAVSYESCWHIEEWKKRQDNDELIALGKFCKLIVDEGLSPSDGILDALKKGWDWAENILDFASQTEDGVELIFTPKPGKVLRYKVRLGKQKTLASGYSYNTRSLGRNTSSQNIGFALSCGTMPRQSIAVQEYLKAHLNSGLDGMSDSEPLSIVHCRLRDSNPLTTILETERRYGTHRGTGSIVYALIALRKFSVLQEVSNLLPEDERGQVLDEIQRVSKEKRRNRKPTQSQYISNRSSTNKTRKSSPIQIYRSMTEFSTSLETSEVDLDVSLSRLKLTETLLGTCRAARNRQSHPAVYNPAFFESPLFFHESTTMQNPLSQPMLRLTSDNQLTLSHPEMSSHVPPLVRKVYGKKEIVTKL